MGLKLEPDAFYRAEDGSKVGPMIGYRDDTYFDIGYGKEGLWRYDGFDVWDYGKNNLIAPWTTEPTGPVRTVTRKEIVPGVYGDVELAGDDTYSGAFGIRINTLMDASRLRAAIATLTEIADALEDGQ